MDSEDEREIEALENHVKEGTHRFCERVQITLFRIVLITWNIAIGDVKALQLRLYQQDEWVDRRNKERILASREKPEYLTIHRLNRFFHSMMGFHSVRHQ